MIRKKVIIYLFNEDKTFHHSLTSKIRGYQPPHALKMYALHIVELFAVPMSGIVLQKNMIVKLDASHSSGTMTIYFLAKF